MFRYKYETLESDPFKGNNRNITLKLSHMEKTPEQMYVHNVTQKPRTNVRIQCNKKTNRTNVRTQCNKKPEQMYVRNVTKKQQNKCTYTM